MVIIPFIISNFVQPGKVFRKCLTCLAAGYLTEPQIPGRGHWAESGCAVLYGGGLRMGQVIGETDARGERAKSGNITFQHIFATMYHVLGIDPAATLMDFNGRPQYLLDDREAIAALV